jgi:hypothetical protein
MKISKTLPIWSFWSDLIRKLIESNHFWHNFQYYFQKWMVIKFKCVINRNQHVVMYMICWEETKRQNQFLKFSYIIREIQYLLLSFTLFTTCGLPTTKLNSCILLISLTVSFILITYCLLSTSCWFISTKMKHTMNTHLKSIIIVQDCFKSVLVIDITRRNYYGFVNTQ